ncbi:Signal transduction histidine kinase [Thalassobaculum litoreum DSM 18839]|uniref:histidine kinase n=2 Tax=Thalassobaculum TaxID=526215 RepID=A0A8G2BKK7_9PROT|nr:Signal transduction histidine kinase [Thalassobaculum litoreum DSM 18839]
MILIIGAVLFSQAIILVVFYIKTDEGIQEQQVRMVIEEIATAYEIGRTTSGSEREKLLRATSDPDIHFQVDDLPLTQNRFDIPHESVAHVPETLSGRPIFATDNTVSSLSIWEFWFAERIEDCLIAEKQSNQGGACPIDYVSIQLNEKEWLNARVLSPVDELVILLPVILSAILSLVGILLIVAIIVKRITAPLRKLSLAAERFGQGEAVGYVEVEGPDELRSTTIAFNTMQESISRFVEDRTKMLAAVSHDLRTPITSLRLRAEFIKDQELKSEMIQTLQDMGSMVEDCLVFAKREVQEEKSETVNLVETLSNLAREFPGVAFSTNLRAHRYLCRPVALRRAIRNVLENAVNYGSKVELSVESEDDGVAIEIVDEGPKVPDEMLDDIFEPFFRVNEGRNTETGNVGLGLSIARTIVHKHGGTIRATNVHNGLKMRIWLPGQVTLSGFTGTAAVE